jgi:NAD(P)-dependent dehydrogenase (short-subunit alcohol dehydrogenase family)
MPTVLVTGANRGIGFQHAKQYAKKGWTVHACVRNPAKAEELRAVADASDGRVLLHALDVTDHAGVDTLATELRGTAIDVLLNNAGTFGPQGAPEGMAYQSLENMDYGIWRDILEINLLAPFKVATAFHDHIAASDKKLLVMMSSGLASIENNTGSSYAYRSSKAGLNIMTKGMAAEWPDLIAIAMAPGWCKTDLGGMEAEIDPADSVRDQQDTFERLTQSDSGRFMDMRGNTEPW